MNSSRCTAPRKDGTPCALPALPSATVCFAHGATRSTKAKGGRQSSTAARAAKYLPEHLRAMQAVLVELVAEVRCGKTPARSAEVIGGLVSRLVELSKYADERGATAALEARLTELEQRLAETPPARAGRW